MPRRRIIHRETGKRARELIDQLNDPRIVTNRAGRSQDFRPLPSARRADDEHIISWSEDYRRKLAPKVAANVETLVNGSSLADINTRRQIVQMALPIPMAVAVVLHADQANPVPGFRGRRRFPVEEISATVALPTIQTGRFEVEFGSGDFRQVIYTDLADGGLQLPVTQFVRVTAISFNPVAAPGDEIATAGAELIPAFSLGNPRASYTIRHIENGAGAVSTLPPPWAREFSGLVHSSDPAARWSIRELVLGAGTEVLTMAPPAAAVLDFSHEVRHQPIGRDLQEVAWAGAGAPSVANLIYEVGA